MTDKDKFGERLATNLKALNAKERDHLMRFAYLGEEGASYEKKPGKFLSKPFLDSLKKVLGDGIPELEEEDCLFAGMDYHIDWLHAALFMAANDWYVWERAKCTCGNSISNHACKCMAYLRRGAAETDPDPGKLDLRPVLGNQEDVDLLVLLKERGDMGKLHLVFIEAKGKDNFGPVQLGRKLVRVNNVITAATQVAGAGMDGWPEFHYLLVSANDRQKEQINGIQFKKFLDGKGDRGKIAAQLLDDVKFNSEVKWLEMKNYPKELWLVQRCNEEGVPMKENAKHWRLTNRYIVAASLESSD